VNRKELMARIKEHFRGRAIPTGGGLFASATGGNPLQDAVRSLDAYMKGNPAPEPGPALPKPQRSLADSSNPELSEEPAVEVRSSEDWGQEFDKFSADLDLVLTLMTGIGVTIAVLSIINTMLMSVTERIIEFGILKANGWSNRAVLKLVTLESAALGLAGGVCGSSLGWVATLLVNARWPDRIHLYASPQLLIFGVAFSTALGILGGMYPAMWASRMLPMDAIRRG
jgi:putative ABC transport system permease protein